MSLTTSKDIFLTEFEKAKSIIDIDKELPGQVFKKPYSKFLIIHFDDIFTKLFFCPMKKFLDLVGGKEFNLLSIDPHPEKYFHKHFHKYPLITFSIENTEEEFLSMLDEDPGDSPADSILVRTDRLVVYSEANDLVIYGERELELGIVVCADDEVEEAFVSSYGKEWIFSVDRAVSSILSTVFYRRGVPQSLIDKLHLNYG